MSMTSLGALNDPGPYQFTCSINNVPHATLTLVIEGVSYVATNSTSITRVLSLSQLTSGIYQFLCFASNSNGGDTQTSQFTIRGKYSKRTKVFVHRQISMYRLCHLSTKESVGNQDGN